MTAVSDLWNIGGYEAPPPNVELDGILTFSDCHGETCQIFTAELLRAFLALEKAAYIPQTGQEWQAKIRGALEEFAAPQTRFAMGEFQELRPVADHICDCCEAEVHAVIDTCGKTALIERWSIVTTVMLLIKRCSLPSLPFDWHQALERDFERICKTGRRIYTARKSGPFDV